MNYLSLTLSITEITYDVILPIWEKYLWPQRTSKIEPTSAMCYLGGYDTKNMSDQVFYLGAYVDNVLVGVNSGHMCYDGSFRSRGLYVHSDYRKQGIGQTLLVETIKMGDECNADFIWSYPRKQSWETYFRAGFELASDWEKSETGINAYCKLQYQIPSNLHRLINVR